MATLELANVVKTFDKATIIHGVDLAVSDGEFVVFVGPSGCGKSTLLRIISGLEPASSGDIRIDGQRVNEVSAAHRGCSMVFQSYALYPHMSVYDNMAFGLENLGVAKALIESKVSAAAAMLQLTPLLQRKPTQLSGGQRQRVAIGRSIVREPKLFLFDEPLSNLDAELRVSMRAEIRDLHARLGATMIYVTHDQVEAMTMADKIVVLRAGRIEQVGSPLELYNRPCNQFVAGFIGSPRMNFVPAAEMPGAKAGAQTVGIRPEHAQLSSDGPLQLAVSQVEQLGSTSILHGKVVDGVPFELILNGQTAIKRGDTVRVSAPAEQLHYFDQNGLRL
ncbi:ATPase component of ABC-type sugar transporter [Polaromonas sp. CF318]|uniref:ABC transporter ATP-binding protein n=1 Tax=Polaromonas sp. CF318 TaxID=1144318 RepID=UPI000270F930|nr:sn-glycerol-3-phosphate ABC transporter ATP-binding protein UgpC [Polaromonas sp. CF318]EJL89016.1 ATPase component of ABC-type sugar transporter [Polaromonas sp. CF318]